MLIDFLPKRTYAVAAAYEDGAIVALIAAAEIRADNSISLGFPKVNPFRVGQTVTLHLDNRTGMEIYDADLRVYRTSYKGSVVESRGERAVVAPLEYQLVYSTRTVDAYRSPVFEYAPDPRPEAALPESGLREFALSDENERGNKLGVLITRSVGQPHSTVMAFLSTPLDDVFLITMKGNIKSRNLHRDPDCCFAIDHRSGYQFEKAYDWNYTILKGRASLVSPGNPLFPAIQTAFVDKNPWESAFFSSPQVEMFHIAPSEIVCPDKFRRRGAL